MLSDLSAFFSGVMQLSIISYLFVPVFIYFLALIIIRIMRF